MIARQVRMIAVTLIMAAGAAQAANPPPDTIDARVQGCSTFEPVVQRVYAPDAQAQIKVALAKKPNATVFSYPGQYHAFSRHNGAHYNEAAATLAHKRTYEFLRQHLR